MSNRAFTRLDIKAIDDKSRTIEGIASTPTPDRLGDIVEPKGAVFKLPMPLLLDHRGDQQVGHVTWAKPTKEGIPFKATIAQIDEAGEVRDLLDKAWHLVKARLRAFVSIGFRALPGGVEKVEGSDHPWALRFTKWEWLELSLVSIPAQAEAVINSKAFDRAVVDQLRTIDAVHRASSGRSSRASLPAPDPSGQSKPEKGKAMKTFAQKIAELTTERGPKFERMKAIQQLALDDDDRDLTAEEAAEFAALQKEVGAIDTNLGRLRALEGIVDTAKAVVVSNVEDGTAARGGAAPAVRDTVPAQAKEHKEKGLDFARTVQCFASANGDVRTALEIAKNRYPKHKGIHAIIESRIKAQVAGATTDDPSWAAPLVDQPQRIIGEFIEWLDPQTILGQFGQNGVPGFTQVPFNIEVPAQVSSGDGYWVGEGRPRPVTSFAFQNITLRWNQVGNICALSKRLIGMSSGSAERLVRDAMGKALIRRIDLTLIDPTVAASADVRPASLTNGAQTWVTTGPTAADVRADVERIKAYFIGQNMDVSQLVLVMRQTQASKLSSMRNALGQKEFPDIRMTGGMLEDCFVLTSMHVPQGVIAAVIAGEVYLADEGGITIEMSTEASLEMATDPTNAITDLASPPQPVETTQVSMFQTSSVALKAERTITWRKRRSGASAYQTGTGWGNADTSPPQAAI